ncbi:hypothetical protein [Streptomyces sp. NBC_00878]|uniref:hypothetical protein n=1 Tax=Streptomyces sp. NBC_00878 TaxID=2975854 RepID=UPI00224E33E4|nr:hypothetical protein [Streptomyces sp. NBC_00878]MCX4911852.1 hypothetical protein [Streptomyces sp. NBC_00878]
MLHSVPAPAEEQRPKKTFPELVAAIYEDDRVGHETRELLLAVAYAVDLAKREDGVSPLRLARRKLGVEHGRQARYDRLVSADAPRYKPPQDTADWGPSGAPGCEAPRLRRYVYRPRQAPSPFDDEAVVRLRPLPETIVHVGPDHVDPVDYRNEHRICGANSHRRVLEKDPRTGWITAHWFCKRHTDQADRVTEQVREQNDQAPEPIPNTGGLLPCYFNADWAKVYKYYRPRWEVPQYGLCADDWPTDVASARSTMHSRMRVIDGADLEGE